MKHNDTPRHRLLWAAAVLVTALAVSPAAHAGGGLDFVDDAKRFYRVVGCGAGHMPSGVDVKVVDKHCAKLRPKLGKFRAAYIDKVVPFLTKLRPTGLPTKVVYPFGGGDLVTALSSYPDATEINTISLEHAGDPRRLASASKYKLAKALRLFSNTARRLLWFNHNKSKWLQQMERGPIPGQLSLVVLGMVLHRYEPVSLKFFELTPEGNVRYYEEADLARLRANHAKRLGSKWKKPDFSVVFRNMEIVMKRGNRTVTYRHFAANLDNKHFTDSPLEKYLLQRGKVSTMTKAASFLLYNSAFTRVRDYLITNMAFMFSDSTGIPPRVARKKGLRQFTFGKFHDAFPTAFDRYSKVIRPLWKSQPHRPLTFMYGYGDRRGRPHMMITTPDANYKLP